MLRGSTQCRRIGVRLVKFRLYLTRERNLPAVLGTRSELAAGVIPILTMRYVPISGILGAKLMLLSMPQIERLKSNVLE